MSYSPTPNSSALFCTVELQLFIGGLVFGNVTTEEAGALVNLLVSRCSGASLEHDLRHTGRLVQLPYGAEIR